MSLARKLSAVTARGILWTVACAVLLSSWWLYTPEASGVRELPADWIFRSWPALWACALAMWLLLTGTGSIPGWLRKAIQLAMSFFVYSGFLYLLRWNPLWNWMNGLGFTDKNRLAGWAILLSTLVWSAYILKIAFGGGFRLSSSGLGLRAMSTSTPKMKVTRPKIAFSDVGGMEEAKRQIREIVENRLKPGKFAKYGVVRNGILLYGPRGSGKTFLAEATAGEFGLNYTYISSPSLLNMWVGETERHTRDVFISAVSRGQTLLFIDEIDALGAARDTGISPGTGTRGYNNITLQMMQSIDEYRTKPGLIIMAATNAIESLDPALIREGRFDAQIRVDLPDEPTRQRIFEARLSGKPWKPFSLAEFARRTPGASAAKIASVVDRAAAYAAEQNRKIEERDLRRALDDTGGKDRPLFEPVAWDDVVIEPPIERELRSLVKQLNGSWSETKGMSLPTGVLLLGPPGTGKSKIGRLIATQTRRSFYPLSAADILGGQVGASVKKLSEIFARARENNPSILFFDEIDGLLPRNHGMLNSHDTQLVEQCRTEIAQLQPEHNVLLIGTTNHLERIDPAILRGGRFSEKIEIGAPGPANRERLLGKYLGDFALAIGIERLAERLAGLAPADIEAICKSALRHALSRSDRDDYIPPLDWEDFEHAIRRVRVQFE